MHTNEFLSQNICMRTSTKILIILTLILFIPNLFLTKYLLEAVVPTGEGFEFSFTTLAWVALVFQVLFNLFFTILFIRFLKTQKLSNMIFFSLFPLTIAYAGFMVYVIDVKTQTGITAESIRSTLNITEQSNSYNNFLWAGLATLVYLVLLFLIVLVACRPLAKVERFAEKLGDGRTKPEKIKVGGGKQFKQIENSLNKINYNFKEKNINAKKIDLATQKIASKQALKFLGKEGIKELEMGNQVKKTATILFCNLKRSHEVSKTISLEENFFYINSYMKAVSPIIKKFDGFVDKYMGDGVLAVFDRAQNAIECAHALLKAVDVKNKALKDKPPIDARVSIFSEEIILEIVENNQNKSLTVVSDIISLAKKLDEINFYIGTKLLISKNSLNLIPQSYDFEYRYTGDLTLDNKEEVGLFESLNCYGKTKRNKLKTMKFKFEAGVRCYNEKNYQKAKTCFEEVLKKIPDDKPSYVYFNKSVEKLKNNAA